jgi:hypothetical protein
MSTFDRTWRKLAAAARRTPPAGDESAPYGFSTRVAALAFAAQPPSPSAFARLSLRAAVVACLLAIVAVAVNFSAITGAFDDDSAVAANDDPIAEVINQGS